MSDILKLQHIKTKNELLGALKARFDYDELVRVSHTIGLLESVKFENAKSNEAAAELAAKDAVVEVARKFVGEKNDPDNVVCDICLARLSSEKHDPDCIVGKLAAALSKVQP